MPTFCCSSGHRVALTFESDQISQPCPACATAVYKFRDAVPDDDVPVDNGAEVVKPGPAKSLVGVSRRHMKMMLGIAAILVGGTVFLLKRPPSIPPQVSNSAVLPITPPVTPAIANIPGPPPSLGGRPPQPAAGQDGVSITDFVAIVGEGEMVTVKFRLKNQNPKTDYPSLSIHWHGVSGPDQLVTKDAYAHPALPFTTADVSLELVRPDGATGIDVKIFN